jgi:L-ribulose-5-phosphate 3-epimerase
MNRRTFLGTAAAAALSPAATRLPIRKAVCYDMLPEKLSHAERFKLARDAGFEQVECNTVTNPREAEEIKKAAEAAKIGIHSVMNSAHWQYPLSSSDPAVVAKSMEGMETSLRNAHFWGADTVLLVPAVVNAQTRYKDAWVRSQQQIRKLLPLAEQLKVIIGVEEVWNKFLLSPLEFNAYVDEFKSPWLKAYFDVGNIAFYGYPQDWIRTLGKRIVKLHFKDFRYRRKEGKVEFPALREGDIDWKEVYKALQEIGYSGTASAELDPGGLDYLREVSRRMDLILSGA